jgi:hypothetical protein
MRPFTHQLSKSRRHAILENLMALPDYKEFELKVVSVRVDKDRKRVIE